MTFDVSGDVSAGAELTVSVGQRSANYDWVVPKSALHNDSNGDFVYKVESKNSPLGNRYVARRVNVQILAMDDNFVAVSGDLGWGDYVITTSTAPLKNWDLVRVKRHGEEEKRQTDRPGDRLRRADPGRSGLLSHRPLPLRAAAGPVRRGALGGGRGERLSPGQLLSHGG